MKYKLWQVLEVYTRNNKVSQDMLEYLIMRLRGGHDVSSILETLRETDERRKELEQLDVTVDVDLQF